MQINQIRLKNFRGYNSLKINFSNGINIFVGKNAMGKTNLLEAIHYLSFAKSFRGIEDKELIQNNASKAIINAEVENNSIKTKIDILITEKGKKILINGKGVTKLSNLSQITNVIVFTPQDVNIFRDSPKNRRYYLDISISKINPIYGEIISRVNNILEERNRILKNEKIDQQQLDIVTNQLINEEKQVILMRTDFIAKLNTILPKVAKAIIGKEVIVKVIYSPFLKISENYLEEAKKLYQNNLENDIKRKATNIGVHREDFILTIGRKNIAIHGSQGENRLMAIALKLSPYFLLEDKHPIVALDDVMSELDEIHQKRLLVFLKKLDQVFITSTNLKINNTSIYEIDNHHIIRRTE